MIFRVRMAATCVVSLFMLVACESSAEPRDYESIRPVFWQELYTEGGITLYCRRSFDEFEPGLNIEHVFPMSWVSRALGCGTRTQCRKRSPDFNLIESDLHNLYPSRVAVNSARRSYPFDEIKGERSLFTECDFELDERRRAVEPTVVSRGEIARAMLYMADRYARHGLELFSRQRDRMRQWDRADPPDSAELERNKRISRLQGNTNPYIDAHQ